MTRLYLARISALLLLIAFPFGSNASLSTIERISPFNSRRPELRPQNVRYIILHNCQGSVSSCVNEVQRYGKAHFVVGYNGDIYQTMDILRLANHAGRSIWNRQLSMSHFSVGIELEGYYEIPPTASQRAALKRLLNFLRTSFRIPAERVLTHSMVAYGVPNRYHDHDHRGRRRCGMMMARPDVRTDLGLDDFPEDDPEVQTGRLIVGDRPLFAFLYNPATPLAIFKARPHVVDQYLRPILTGEPQLATAPIPMAQPREEEHNDEPVKFREIGVNGGTAYALAGKKFNAVTTIYFLTDGRIFNGSQMQKDQPALLARLPKGTKVLVGYVYGGKVLPTRSAFSIVRNRWSDPTTIYRLPDGQLRTGDQIASNQISVGTIILFQR